MIDLTITRQMLDTVLQSWFHNIKNAEQAKAEILALSLRNRVTDIPGVSRISGSSPERLLTVGTGCNMILWVSRGALPLCSPWTSHP